MIPCSANRVRHIICCSVPLYVVPYHYHIINMLFYTVIISFIMMFHTIIISFNMLFHTIIISFNMLFHTIIISFHIGKMGGLAAANRVRERARG